MEELNAKEATALEEKANGKVKLFEQYREERNAKWAEILNAVKKNIDKLLPKYNQWLESVA